MRSHVEPPTARQLFFPDAPVDDVESEARERAFFHALRMRNGTNKTTYSHRLDGVNDIVNPLLPTHRPLDVMDVAVSSGLGTLEWMESLERAGIDYRMTAGDLCVTAYLLSFTSSVNALVDSTGYPLQLDVRGRAVPYPIGRRRALRNPTLLALAYAVRWIAPRVLQRLRHSGRARRLLLVSPRLAARRPLEIIDDDILVPGRFERSFDVIRAANVLSPLYFTDRVLKTMAGNLTARLRPNGILVVCKTDERDVNHGTIFRLSDAGGLEVVRRFGEGAEREAVIRAD